MDDVYEANRKMANEVQRLQKERTELRDALQRLQKERTALRDALQDIANDLILEPASAMPYKRGVAQIIAIARDALKGAS